MSTAASVLILFAVAVWLGLGYRVHRDARRRIVDCRFTVLSSLVGFGVPFLGPVVYTMLRPPETLADAHARELEMRTLRRRLLQAVPRCPVCACEVESRYVVCPVCTTRLRERCGVCRSPLDPLWRACTYCTAPASARARASSRRRRRPSPAPASTEARRARAM